MKTIVIKNAKVYSEAGDTFITKPQIGVPLIIITDTQTRNTTPVQHFATRPDGRTDWASTQNTHYRFEYDN
jgi:hypothetical protein